jgi:UDP-N-acetylglucosamine 2-epimerase (non-hydrolysing)
MFVFGTRPEAVKMAPIVKEVEKFPDVLESIVTVTGQHRQMLDQVLEAFRITPDYDLGIMEEAQSLSQIVSRCLTGLEGIILRERPDIILVQGDTSTAFATALSAYYHKKTLGHVEAGLRTGDKFSPYPEEANRRLISTLTDLHFAPTTVSSQNLLNEGIPRSQIYLTGNSVIDAVKMAGAMPYDLAKEFPKLERSKKLILVTLHRRESFGLPMREVCEAIKEIAQTYKSAVQFLLPVHKNPLVSSVVRGVLGNLGNVILTEPLDYLPFVNLIKAAYFILTDSGGIQEEAPTLGKPVLVVREKTERPEAIMAGTSKLVGTSREKVCENMQQLLNDQEEYNRMSHAVNPYGDGRAAERITGALLHYFGFTDKRPEEFA